MSFIVSYLQSLLPRLAVLPLLLISLTLHELSHGYVAYLMGDPTAKRMGRLTLNPLKHLDPIGTICMVIAPFGWAKPVPINPYQMKKPKLGMALSALAGPLCNLLLAFVFTIVYAWVFPYIYTSNFAITAFSWFITINCTLAVFNLIPFPPLDGSKVLFSVLPEKAYFGYMKYEQYGMIILFVLIFFNVFDNYISVVTNAIIDLFLRFAMLIF